MTKNKRTKHIFLALAALACSATVLGVIAANNVKTNIFRASDVDSEYTVTFSYDSLTAAEKSAISSGTGSIVRTLPGGSGARLQMNISNCATRSGTNLVTLNSSSSMITFNFLDNVSNVTRFKSIKELRFGHGSNTEAYYVYFSAIDNNFSTSSEYTRLNFSGDYRTVEAYDVSSNYPYAHYLKFVGQYVTHDFTSISIVYSCGAEETGYGYENSVYSKGTISSTNSSNTLALTFNNNGKGSGTCTYMEKTSSASFDYSFDVEGNLNLSNIIIISSHSWVKFGIEHFQSGQLKIKPNGAFVKLTITVYNESQADSLTYTFNA